MLKFFKQKKVIAIITALIIILTIILYGYNTYMNNLKKLQQEVKITQVTRKTITEVVNSTGTINPQVGAQINVGARVTGQVIKLNVQVGSVVQAGEVLAEIDPRPQIAALEQAKSNYQAALSNYNYAKINYERYAKLFEEGLISKDKYDSVKANYLAQKGTVDAAKAAVNTAQTNLEYCTITAPISGMVSAVTTHQGETVVSGLNAPNFVTIDDLDKLEVDASIDETDIGKVKVGMPATFTVLAYPNKTFTGTVAAIYPTSTVVSNVVYYTTVIKIDSNPEHFLRPGMTANVNIKVQEKKDVLAVPNLALKTFGNQTVVFVETSPGVFEKRIVKTGISDLDYTEITSGLKEGDKVIVGDIPENLLKKIK
ncbi:membrane fusion protein, macrolide-specific efflux system [Thermodesulfobium acidiphilum]|uniref:Membrane fusion protein, macrolide-specific efflux system n=1 Tax=Thermodesulfobium acidiphilum TaxID=1794699 RepID=A0A2R4W106_THEAF|nr:efflux RND transporter periplasmic adaptor subunit [Thermodesulfobium acidiphilum]AWB10455.1 membrane fusion protein, macrolide-specific efflux system [Thermodesulfobium acidiphilum]